MDQKGIKLQMKKICDFVGNFMKSLVVKGLSKNLSQKIGILRRLRKFMSNAALLKIYNTVVFPHFKSGVQPKTKLLLTDFLDYRKGLAESF